MIRFVEVRIIVIQTVTEVIVFNLYVMLSDLIAFREGIHMRIVMLLAVVCMKLRLLRGRLGHPVFISWVSDL